MAVQHNAYQQCKPDDDLLIEKKTTHQILSKSDPKRHRLRIELTAIYDSAFPKMPKDERMSHVEDYFRRPEAGYLRRALFYRNRQNELIATCIFVQGTVNYRGDDQNTIYVMTRAVLPVYRSYGLGKALALRVLTEYQPDVLFTTCAQSSSLHSWLNLSSQRWVKGFEVYPELTGSNGTQTLKRIPRDELEFIVNTFGQTYFEVARGDRNSVDKAVNNLTRTMVRKSIYSDMYDFDPWGKDGREDKLAKALYLSGKDGVLVVYRKNINHLTEP